MAIRSYLTGTIGLSHLFMFDDATRDSGSTGVLTTGSATTGSFVADPVCEGVTNSYQSLSGTSDTEKDDGFVIGNTSDINVGTSIWQEYSIIIWFKIPEVTVPTCIYEQGGGTNNLAINVGIAKAITGQAADAGQPFLIAQSNFLAEANRPYFVQLSWQRHTLHAGSGNRIFFYVNGVLQEEVEKTGTDGFPSHTGDITVGNTDEDLQSYNGTKQRFAEKQKNVNMLGILSDSLITESESREIFERTVLPELTIAADTVANQQTALDALISNSYSGVNCAIRILQATDETNYRLFIDDITFAQDSNLRDISIQFVGTGTLTIENTNGSNASEVSTPAEVDLDGTTVLTGGGSIVIVENTIRYTSDNTITGSSATKLVFDGSGTSYTVSGGTISEFENVSGSTVTVSLTNNAPTPTLTETSGAITLTQNVDVTAANLIDGTRVQLYNVTDAAEIDNSVVSGGSGYSYTLNLQGSDGDAGDTLRLRATYQSGTSAKESFEESGVLTTSGLSFIGSQVDDAIYNGFALDGSTITKFDADYTDDEIDLIVGSNFSSDEAYAWWVYNLTTSQGIQEFFGGITAEDSANFKINTSILNLYWDNDTTSNVYQTDNRRIYRDDLAYPVKDPTTGGGGIDVVWRSQVLLANDLSTSDIRDAVWNASASSYTTAGSMGWETILAGRIIVDTTTTGTPTTTTLQLTAGSTTDDFYNNEIIYIASGTIAGQARIISDYDGATKTITVSAPFISAPASGVRVVVQTTHTYTSSELLTFAENGVWDASASSHTTVGSMGWENILAGRIIVDTTTTGMSTTTTLQLTAGSTVDDFYNNELIYIADGALAGQARIIADYDGTTKTITVSGPFTSAPASGVRVVVQTTHTYTSQEIQSVAESAVTNVVVSDVTPNLTKINTGVQKASKLIPHSTDLS